LGFITSYNGTSKLAIVQTAWSVVPDNTSAFAIGNFGMDQNANATGNEPVNGGSTQGDAYFAPNSLANRPFSAPYDAATLPLIVPGPHIVSTEVRNGSNLISTGSDNLVLNNTVSSIDIVFDRDMDPTWATRLDNGSNPFVARLIGPIGTIGPGQNFP